MRTAIKCKTQSQSDPADVLSREVVRLGKSTHEKYSAGWHGLLMLQVC